MSVEVMFEEAHQVFETDVPVRSDAAPDHGEVRARTPAAVDHCYPPQCKIRLVFAIGCVLLDGYLDLRW